VIGDLRQITLDAHQLERQPHSRRRGQRRRELDPQLTHPVLDHAHRRSLPQLVGPRQIGGMVGQADRLLGQRRFAEARRTPLRWRRASRP
jgi:hypothetical protein